MINIYDIARDENRLPSLVKTGSYDVKWNITTDINGIAIFIRDYLKPYIYDSEHVYLLAMDYYGRALGVFLLGIGDYKGCEVSKRNIAECLMLSGARQFMLIHNHPDGATSLSLDDHLLASDLDQLAKLFDIKSLGNCAVTERGMISTEMDKVLEFDELED